MGNDIVQPDPLMSFLPLLLISIGWAVAAYFLAKEKGHHCALWAILALIPIVNMWCIPYFVGASNRRLEDKIDLLLKTSGDS